MLYQKLYKTVLICFVLLLCTSCGSGVTTFSVEMLEKDNAERSKTVEVDVPHSGNEDISFRIDEVSYTWNGSLTVQSPQFALESEQDEMESVVLTLTDTIDGVAELHMTTLEGEEYFYCAAMNQFAPLLNHLGSH